MKKEEQNIKNKKNEAGKDNVFKRDFDSLKSDAAREKRIIKEMASYLKNLENAKNIEEGKMFISHIISLKEPLRKTAEKVSEDIEKAHIEKPLAYNIPYKKETIEEEQFKKPLKVLEITRLEKDVVKRLKRKEERIIYKRAKKPSSYVKFASKMFSKYSINLIKKGTFDELKKDLLKSNLEFVPVNYVSVTFLTAIVSAIFAFFIFLFFLFFNLNILYPFISISEGDMFARFLRVFWVLFIVPIGTFLFMYLYPSLERKSAENKINQELPFATIHMSAISSSMIEPSRIFSIIILTKEYPYLEKEFIKIINEINIYGYDLVSALRSVALKTPSIKLTELFNGIATTINSGGNLPEFFDKRAETLLLEYRLDREQYAKTAETFMDIYISLVIAAPMIFMLLLIMMRVSGLGVGLSTSMISLIMVLGVSMINVVFLVILNFKQPGK